MYFNPHSYLQVSHININNYIFCSGSFAVLRNISLMLYCLQSYSLQIHEQEFIVIKIVYCFFFLLGSGGTCTDQKLLVFQLGCSGVGRVREIIVFASINLKQFNRKSYLKGRWYVLCDKILTFM